MNEEMQDRQMGMIEPERLAKKIADIRRLKFPALAHYCSQNSRAIEALWSIQWFSMQPGGMPKFDKELLEFMEPRLGTVTARRLGRRKYTRAECLAVWEETGGHRPDSQCEIIDLLGGEESPAAYRRRKEIEEFDRKEAEARRFEGNEPYFHKLACDAANDELREMLESFCIGNQEQVSRWWCADVLAEVLAFVDARAQLVRQRLAPTVVAEKIFDALEYAVEEQVMVRIEGCSRFGKSEAIETFALMYPGRVRVIRTPSSNSERDLIKAVAEAFGIHQTFGTRSEANKDKVEFTIRFSGMMLVFDEGAFLVPSAYTAHTAPARLNWIRCAIVDRKIPCVIVVTPQSYNTAVSRFVKKTNYSIEQFLGREAMRISLPTELSHEDLLAVSRVHFPEASEGLLMLIVAKALQSESYLKAVESIAKRARYLAKKRNAKKLTLTDVETAIMDVMPQAAPIAEAVTPAAPRVPRKPRSQSSAATVLKTQFRGSANDFPARNTTPLHDSRESDPALATG
jgi:hypothetical protein